MTLKVDKLNVMVFLNGVFCTKHFGVILLKYSSTSTSGSSLQLYHGTRHTSSTNAKAKTVESKPVISLPTEHLFAVAIFVTPLRREVTGIQNLWSTPIPGFANVYIIP